MSADPRDPTANELDPLPTASMGTALVGVASLVWPELIPAALSLAVLASFVVWVRVLRTVRENRTGGSGVRRFIPLFALGVTGWSAALFLGSILPWGRALLLGGVAIGLWLLARMAAVGV